MMRAQRMRWFGHPAVVGSVLAVLAIDFLLIPSGNANRSIVQRAVLGNLRPSTAHGRPLLGNLCRADGKLEWVWLWDDRYDAILRGQAEGYEDLEATVFFDLVRYDGLYHLTRRREELTIWCKHLTPDEWRQVPDVVAGTIAGSDDATGGLYSRQRELLAMAPVMRAADREVRIRVTPLSAGRLRNAVAMAVLGLAIGMFWFGRTWLWAPLQWRRRARLQRGQCAACGYDLAGLKRPGPCPECGATR